jgi:hypothetical protein
MDPGIFFEARLSLILIAALAPALSLTLTLTLTFHPSGEHLKMTGLIQLT